MNKVLKSSLMALGATLALSGCSLPNLFGTPTSADINGDGSISQGEQVMAAYTQTLAGSGPSSAAAAMAATGGISGAGVGSLTPIASVGALNAFKNATIKVAADNSSMDITVDGKTFNIGNGNFNTTRQINGQTYTVNPFYGNATQWGSVTGTGDLAGTTVGQYSSIASFFKNATYTLNTSITTNHPAISIDIDSHDGFIFLATGLETPNDQLPNQVVAYSGLQYTLSGVDQHEDVFATTIDFGSGTMAGSAGTGVHSSAITGSVNGNRFAGTLTAIGARGINGEVIGAFYGPNAEEIVGTTSGTVGTEAAAGYIVGNKN